MLGPMRAPCTWACSLVVLASCGGDNLPAVHESQVSRDERNEYHGITVDRASRILDALHVHLTSRFDEPVVPRPAPATRTQRVHG